jgi:hypothetical protein
VAALGAPGPHTALSFLLPEDTSQRVVFLRGEHRVSPRGTGRGGNQGLETRGSRETQLYPCQHFMGTDQTVILLHQPLLHHRPSK